ncbi:MAG TPA: glycerophosphodiester phosphodiesterase [Candidatus Saccharimonadales bacterium]|nr:glycerophosphodiester phosphodiesterase [Candidatus Saccharimonadales bacterium]
MKIIGHRGARGLAPENTLRSFEKALEHHVDQLEFDLRVTSDNIIVLHHDPALVDAAGNRLTIRTTPYDILKQHKSDLLTFHEFARRIGTKVHLYIEIKPDEPVKLIAKALQDQLKDGWKPDGFSIASFDQSVLVAMHRLFPEVEMVVIEKWSSLRARFRARQVGTKRLAMNQRWLWRGFLRAMHRAGYQISPYTVNDPARARKWQPYIYGVVTDRPDLFEKQSL